MAIEVQKPGLATTVQDLGRPGYYDVGIPLSGAMDRFALRAANLLVGNDEGAAALECVFMGPELAFTADAVVAVTGAELPPKLDGAPQPDLDRLPGQGRAGAVVRLSQARRARLSRGRGRHRRAGRARQPLDLCARRARRLRGPRPQGRRRAGGRRAGRRAARAGRFRAGRCGAAPCRPPLCASCPASTITASPQEAADGFFGDTWKVAPEADRIGYRFRGGRPLAFVDRKQPFGAGSDPSNIVDSCYPYGSIQVPGGTEPIVLHRDAVSGGGYFMLGTVISADMDFIGQLQPHATDPVRARDDGGSARGAARAAGGAEPGQATSGIGPPHPTGPSRARRTPDGRPPHAAQPSNRRAADDASDRRVSAVPLLAVPQHSGGGVERPPMPAWPDRPPRCSAERRAPRMFGCSRRSRAPAH